MRQAAVEKINNILEVGCVNAGVMSDAQYSLLSRLRRLVSEAERAPVDGLSGDDAAEFVGLALRLAGSLGDDA